MRCDAVTRELSAPTGRLDPAAHLASCPACAAFAMASERLDRAWAATAPPAPPADAFDAAWARIAAAKPAPALRLPPRWARAFPDVSRRRVLFGAAFLQAAIVLVAVGLGLRHGASRAPGPQRPTQSPQIATQAPGPEVPPQTPLIADPEIDIAEGELVLISLDSRSGVVEVISEALPPDALAPDFDIFLDMFNDFEAMASL